MALSVLYVAFVNTVRQIKAKILRLTMRRTMRLFANFTVISRRFSFNWTNDQAGSITRGGVYRFLLHNIILIIAERDYCGRVVAATALYHLLYIIRP